MKRYSEQEAAQLVLAYYKVLDSDRTAEDYLLRCDAILRVCMNAFNGYTYVDNNRIITLFLICNQMDINTIALDEMGAEESSRLAHDAFNKTDTNLRAVVSVLTGEEIELTYNPETYFVNQFSPPSNVVYITPKKDK